MKAYHIMMFLFIFNMFFWVITVGLSIYNVDVGVDPGFDLSGGDTTNIGLGLLSAFSLLRNPGVGIFGLAIAISGGAMIGIFTAGQGAAGVVYGLYSYFFWSAMSNSFFVLYGISNNSPYVLFVILIFGAIVGVIFAAGLFQMVTGGWKAHE